MLLGLHAIIYVSCYYRSSLATRLTIFNKLFSCFCLSFKSEATREYRI